MVSRREAVAFRGDGSNGIVTPMSRSELPEIYVATDVEADGPIPGSNSMLPAWRRRTFSSIRWWPVPLQEG